MADIINEWYITADERSRYKNDLRIEFKDGEKCVETHDRITFQKSPQDRKYTVESGFENRLDLISWKVYGTSLYWWAIAAASNIYDPFDVPVGTVLTVPPLSEVRRK